jgi:hypothetical protein
MNEELRRIVDKLVHSVYLSCLFNDADDQSGRAV